jgi:tetratricopeptide (TPR) repeat protein
MQITVQIKTMNALAVLFATASLASAEVKVSELWVKSLAAEADGDNVNALELHEQLLPEVDRVYSANLRAGWLYYMNENYSAALKYYEEAACQSRGALAPLYGALNCQLALGQTNRAMRVARAILVIDDLNYTANSQLAASYYQERKFSMAVSYYQKLNSLYPEDLAIASGLAWSHLELGEPRQAEPLFREILMISPDYAFAERGLEICIHTAG